MSVPIPPPDPYNEAPPLWRRIIVVLLLAVWPAGALFSPPRLRSRGGQLSRPGLHCPGRGAVVGGNRGRDGPGCRHFVCHPRQPEAGGGHHNRGERIRPDIVVGSRPRDS